MRFLRRLPLQQKLVVGTTLISFVALALGYGAFAFHELDALRNRLARELAVLAEVFGQNSAAGLAFNDAGSIDQTLKTLRAVPQVIAAQVYDPEGAPAAEYRRVGAEAFVFPSRKDEAQEFGAQRLDTFRAIRLRNETVGTIYLGLDLQELRDQARRYMLGAGGLLLVCMGVAAWLARGLQRFISAPIEELARAAAAAAANNYTVRAVKESEDEVGRLVDGFNAMLAQIQSRDAALQRARDELEERVEKRTRALAAEVTERRKMEQERDGFFALSLDLLCVATLEGKFRRVNPAFHDVLGHAVDELAGQPFLSLVHEEDQPALAAQLQRLMLGATVTELEVRMLHRDGSYRWIVWSAAPRPGKDYFYAYGRDVTALKQAEEQMAREQARFKFIFESVPVGISLDECGPEGLRDRLMNDAHLRICGVTREEAVYGIFGRLSHTEDYERQRKLRAELDRGLIDRFSIEKRYIRPDGRVVWVTFSLQRRHYADGTWQDLSTIVDITALKAAQEEVATERTRLRFIFEAIPVGISLVRPGDNVHLVNPAHERITGVSAANSQEPGIFGRASHPDDYRRQMELAQPFLRGEVDSYSVEKRYLHPNGRVVWAVLTSRMFTDQTTGTRQCVTSLVDVTELKRAQEEITAEQTRFKFIFDSVPVGISLLIPGEKDTYVVNPAHERVTGIRPEELTGPGVFERASHPDDFEHQRPVVEAYKRGEIDQFTLEKRYVHRDGRIVWVSLSRRMFLDRLGRKQSITTVIDITDLKKAQEEMARQQARFKFIFDSAPVGFAWSVDGDLSKRIVNPEAVRITGVPVENSRDLERYREATHPDDRVVQDEMVRQLTTRKIDRYEMEKRYCHPDGAVRWAAIKVQIFRGAATGEDQELTTFIDITERKRAEAKLAETHRELVASSRQAGMAEVATGVLHNVGNVLNSVNVSASLIADGVRRSKIDRVGKLSDLLQEQAENLPEFFRADPRGKQLPTYLQSLAKLLTTEQGTLLAEADSLRRNIEHIKSIVAMQQSYAKVSGVAEPVPVIELVEDAIRMNASGIARDDLELVRDFQATPTVATEKHKVLQILVNLLRNARHACEEAARKPKRITVSVVTHGRGVKIAVSDTGVGIARENLTRIFAHGFTTKKHGHGFGLHSGAIAAKELGGALTARSDGPGTGATFVLELPYAQDAKAA